jgi:hypothetical protein
MFTMDQSASAYRCWSLQRFDVAQDWRLFRSMAASGFKLGVGQ